MWGQLHKNPWVGVYLTWKILITWTKKESDFLISNAMILDFLPRSWSYSEFLARNPRSWWKNYQDYPRKPKRQALGWHEKPKINMELMYKKRQCFNKVFFTVAFVRTLLCERYRLWKVQCPGWNAHWWD